VRFVFGLEISDLFHNGMLVGQHLLVFLVIAQLLFIAIIQRYPGNKYKQYDHPDIKTIIIHIYPICMTLL
jgi:hypothetical protein